jgi:hypothetical protein
MLIPQAPLVIFMIAPFFPKKVKFLAPQHCGLYKLPDVRVLLFTNIKSKNNIAFWVALSSMQFNVVSPQVIFLQRFQVLLFVMSHVVHHLVSFGTPVMIFVHGQLKQNA